MQYLANGLSGLLALVFGAAGVSKLAGAKRQIDTADHLRIARDRYRLIAIPELAAAAGLLIGFLVAPVAAAAALGLAVLMVGALTCRVRVRDSAAYLAGDSAFLAAAVAVAAVRAMS